MRKLKVLMSVQLKLFSKTSRGNGTIKDSGRDAGWEIGVVNRLKY